MKIEFQDFFFFCISSLERSIYPLNPYFLLQPPVITGLPSSINLIESATGSTTASLYTLTVSDPDPGDTYTCTITPPVTGFQVTAGKLQIIDHFEIEITVNVGIHEIV